MNHSCNPEAYWSLNSESGLMQTRAITSISPGEEITISYCGLLLTTAGRRKVLLEKWCFVCQCSRCQADDPEDISYYMIHEGLEPETFELLRGQRPTTTVPLTTLLLENMSNTMMTQNLVVPALAFTLTQLSILWLEAENIEQAVAAASAAQRTLDICYGAEHPGTMRSRLWVTLIKDDPGRALAVTRAPPK